MRSSPDSCAGEVQRVLQNLLRERVSIRDLETILETLAEHAGKTRDTDLLTERVRVGLGRRIIQHYRGSDGRLRVVTLSRSLDARLGALADEVRPAESLGTETVREIVRAVALGVGLLVEGGHPPVVLSSSAARGVEGPHAGRFASTRGPRPRRNPPRHAGRSPRHHRRGRTGRRRDDRRELLDAGRRSFGVERHR